jgi:hypothetical protein
MPIVIMMTADGQQLGDIGYVKIGPSLNREEVVFLF